MSAHELLGDVGRYSRALIFDIGLPEGYTWAAATVLPEDVDTEDLEGSGLVDVELLQEVRELAKQLPTERGSWSVEPSHSDVGRGASGMSIAIEIAHHLNTIGGMGGFFVLAAKPTLWIWKKIADRHGGNPPPVSLGAAIHLAAAHLIDHIGKEDFELHEASEIEKTPDASFTGVDHFIVIFGRKRQFYVYLVDGVGNPTLLGSYRRERMWDDNFMPEGQYAFEDDED